MATYILPQTRVFQELQLAAEVDVQERNACIVGPDAVVYRYSDATLKNVINLGTYNSSSDECYAWPEKPVGSVIDTSYTKLYIDNALLRYHRDQTDTLVKVAANKVRSPNTSWIANPADPATYPRSASLKERDVQVGDTVYITGSTGVEVKTLCTYVKDIEADPVAAVIGPATADDNNAESQGADSQWQQIGGADNCITITAIQGNDYNGLEDGDITEVYTVTVTTGSTAGDATTATLKVTSASGNDDVISVTPSAFGVATPIGTRGLYVIWDEANSLSSACSIDADDDGVSHNDFIIGQKWEIIVSQAFTPVSVSSAGSVYTGTTDKTYIVEVTKGGAFADSPQITVRADDGTDFSGPTTVSASGSAVAVGTKGVVITFTGSALRKGDIYTIEATAETNGAYKTLVLGHNLDSGIPLNDAGTAELDLSLFIKKNIQVTEQRVDAAPQVNFTQSDTEFCVKSGIQAYDSSWTDNGVEEALDVITVSGCANTNQLYVEYRAWTSSLTDTVRSISDVGDLDLAFEGALTPDNPLKYAVFKALQNANGQEVRYLAVANPADTSSWITALDILEDRTDVYGLVPLTRDQTVLDLFEAHVDAQSSATVNRWRVLWVNVEVKAAVAVVSEDTSSDGNVVKAVVEDDADTSGNQYTIVRVTTGNSDFEENGVRAGDELRISFTTDGFGNETYTSYVIDAVLSEDSLRLVSGPAASINTATKIEVWHTRNREELSNAIATTAGNWANRRVRAVWPDTITVGDEEVSGLYLCAALAGLVSGVVPQQGLTNLEIAGFDAVPRTTKLFNRSQLDNMAGSGTWIVTQEPRTGVIYSRHAVTTGDYDDINQREELATRKLDTMSYYLYQRYSPYIGVSNNVPSMLDVTESETKAGIQFLRSAYFTPRLGGVIEDAEIIEIRRSLEFKDRQLVALSVNLGYPLNNIDVYLFA